MLTADYCRLLGVQWEPPPDLAQAAADAINACGDETAVLAPNERRSLLLGLINQKFGFNDSLLQTLLDRAAERGRILNYHEKIALRTAIDFGDQQYIDGWISEVGFTPEFREVGTLSNNSETLRRFTEQLVSPTISRSDARVCDVAERRHAILRSLYASYVFRCFPTVRMHAYFNEDSRREYVPDFYKHLLLHHSSMLSRACSLLFLVVPHSEKPNIGLLDDLYAFIEQAYSRLANHCYLSILIKSSSQGASDAQWGLFSDIVLYAEKFRESDLRTGYFQPQKIAAITQAYIRNLPVEKTQFHLANEGFLFRDALILPHARDVNASHYDVLLLFEKSERDERPIPCPACRSLNVRGNSYPSLGVKSWECQNILCPERSAFDRGNRYSLASLIKQHAIASERDQIPAASLRRWKLDFVPAATETEIVDMLLRHFTLHDDTAVFVNTDQHGHTVAGRHIRYEPLARTTGRRYERFQNSPLFARFLVDKHPPLEQTWQSVNPPNQEVEVYQGDAFEVLSSIAACSIDGAVTSPPYYNARSYAVWPNVYCYLYDMYNVAREVYRVLRSGAYFVFNIFDYFDNENTVVLSSMGKKRMILGAYIVNAFRRTGFDLQGNTVWYKGEIEGKRNFNQGNRSPYYQFPLNCWEHVFVFRKPGVAEPLKFPSVLSVRPVIKMVRGRNTLGHSAPFPEELPQLLIRHLRPGGRVLDPFSGSMTTARVAGRFGVRSISIDLHLEYCRLGLDLLKRAQSDATLFPRQTSNGAKDVH